MRRSKEDAAETRKSIVNAAATRFRKNGISETALAALMKAAGLTHGGFYRHFASKDQLVAEACAAAFAAGAGELDATTSKAKARRGLGAVAKDYLSSAHRDDPANGCPLAALGSELARSDRSTRAAATAGILKMADAVAHQMRGAEGAAAKSAALATIATMVGALTMSRIVADPKLSDAILAAARSHIASQRAAR